MVSECSDVNKKVLLLSCINYYKMLLNNNKKKKFPLFERLFPAITRVKNIVISFTLSLC